MNNENWDFCWRLLIRKIEKNSPDCNDNDRIGWQIFWRRSDFKDLKEMYDIITERLKERYLYNWKPVFSSDDTPRYEIVDEVKIDRDDILNH